MKKILLISYGGGHANTLSPIYKLLKNNNDVVVDYLACTTAFGLIENLGLGCFSYSNLAEELYTVTEKEQIQSYGKKLALEMGDSILSFNESVIYLGVNFFNLVLENGEEKSWELYREKQRSIFLPLDFAKRVLNKYKYDLVVSTTSPRTEEAFYRAAHILNINSLCIMDLYSLPFVENSLVKDWHAPHIYCPVGYSVDIERLISSTRLVYEANNPAFDYLANPVESLQGLNWGRHNIVFIKSPSGIFDEVEEKALRILIEVCKKRLVQLIIRHHPNDDFRLEPSNDYLICDDIDIHSVLYNGGLFVTVVSTVGVEASIMGRRVLQITDSNTKPGICFKEQRIGDRINIDTEALESYVFDWLDEDLESRDEKLPYKKTAPGIVNRILSIINICKHEENEI